MKKQIKKTMIAFAVVAVALIAAIAAGCCLFLKAPQYPGCRWDSDCSTERETCVNKQCQECVEDSQCPEAWSCKSGRCEEGSFVVGG